MVSNLIWVKRVFLFASIGIMAVILLSLCGCKKKVCPFSNAAGSPEEIATRMLAALENRDEKAMWALRITQEEYNSILWPPYGNKFGGEPSFSWSINCTDSKKAIDRALIDYGGQKLQLVRVYFGMGKDQHEKVKAPFTIWRDFRVVVKDENGEEKELRCINTVIEMNGGYKVGVFHS